MRVVQRFIVLVLIALFFGIIGRSIYLDCYYYAYAPRQADPASGAVVPVTIHHGAKVFLTKEQWRWFDSPYASVLQFSVCLAAAVGAHLLDKRWPVFRDTYGDRNSTGAFRKRQPR